MMWPYIIVGALVIAGLAWLIGLFIELAFWEGIDWWKWGKSDD